MYTKDMLKAVANQVYAIDYITYSSDPVNEPPLACLIAGRGEIQVNTDGEAYWLRWTRNGAITEDIELSPPDTDSATALAQWMIDTAKQFEDR
jgi:hemin uptake protein HemP